MRDYLDGTLVGLDGGFHFSSPPPPGIEHRRFLTSSDPDEVLACVLANVQQGVFEVTDVLPRLLETCSEPGVWPRVTVLIGYAAPMPLVRWLAERADSAEGPYTMHDALSASVDAGSLAIVPQLLDAQERVSEWDARLFLHQDLSFLLEDGSGPIVDGPDEIEVVKESWAPEGAFPPVLDFDGYRALVARTLRTVEARAGGAATIAEGEPVHVRRVAERLLRCVTTREAGYRIAKGRTLLEAFTGIDCRGFYNEHGVVKPLAAAAIVERVLEDGRIDSFEIGKRYFFGHLIPS